MSQAKFLSQKVQHKNILVVGTARDCSKTIDKAISVIQRALIDFNNVSFFIVESDSNDDTVKKLYGLADRVKNFSFISLGILNEKMPTRTERIAFCRNKYLDFIYTSSQKYDYVLVTDLDGVSRKLNRQAILSCWIRDDWAACFANQTGPYYDIWALRHPELSPTNCWEEYKSLIALGKKPYFARRKAINSKMLRIDRNSNWIEVDSAFGGLGIYNASILESSWYTNTDEFGFEASEHVSFNNSIRSKNGKLFINPALINGSWNEHSRGLRKTSQILSFGKFLYSFILK